ncbi:IMPACT family protein [Flavihumibacter profundi]|uniref:IMPACT family protein n=1 Tax=Flavihumibacter profundi TaxID=2716883 RepID=UPI001CC42B8E|nr:YigZ family protein [Flavihumibacter profundi]MBZ5857208.1 YigZ family protein [Flavihumibacter profundi]
MDTKTFYTTLEKQGTAEFRERGSKFIGYAFPLNSAGEFKEILQHIKKEHPKASHYCFAYRLGLDGNNFRVNDDGEPSGTAGKPILGQIDSKELTNVGIVVVRYFGGTLLGVPGLINAYKTTATVVLQTLPFIQKPIELKYRLEFDYTTMNQVMMIIKQFNCSIISQEIQLFCFFTIGIPVNRREEVLYRLKDLNTVTVSPVTGI